MPTTNVPWMTNMIKSITTVYNVITTVLFTSCVVALFTPGADDSHTLLVYFTALLLLVWDISVLFLPVTLHILFFCQVLIFYFLLISCFSVFSFILCPHLFCLPVHTTCWLFTFSPLLPLFTSHPTGSPQLLVINITNSKMGHFFFSGLFLRKTWLCEW